MNDFGNNRNVAESAIKALECLAAFVYACPYGPDTPVKHNKGEHYEHRNGLVKLSSYSTQPSHCRMDRANSASTRKEA